jgi:hypothetical protein
MMKAQKTANTIWLLSILLTTANLSAAPPELKLGAHSSGKSAADKPNPKSSSKSEDLRLNQQSPRPPDDKRSMDLRQENSNPRNDQPMDLRQLEGSSSGGGNDKVVTPDGKPDLASHYVTLPEDFRLSEHIPAGKPYQIPENVRNELGKLQRILHSTLVQVDSHNYDVFGKAHLNEGDFIATEILSEGLELLLVPEIPDGAKDPVFAQCLNVTRNVSLPRNATRSRSACTLYSTPYTLMQENDFAPPKDGSAELRFQALSLAHEGLRRRGILDEDITRIDQALALALDLLNEQTKGQLRELTPEEITKMRWLLRLSFQYGLASKGQQRFPKWLNKVQVWKKGGGYTFMTPIKNAPADYQQDGVDPSVFIGMATVAMETYIPANVILIDTNICQAQGCIIGPGAHVLNTHVEMISEQEGAMIQQRPVRIGDRSVLENVVATDISRMEIGTDNRIVNFQFDVGQLLISQSVQIQNVKISYDYGKQGAVGAALKHLYEVKLWPRSRIENISLSAGVPIRLQSGATLRALNPQIFRVVRKAPGFLQNENNIGLNFNDNANINLGEFAKGCQQKDGKIIVETFQERISSDADLQKICMKNADSP